MQRKIELSSIDADAFDKLCERTNRLKVYEAIGYLSTWCATSDAYPRMTIWCDSTQDEMTATYWKADDSVGYVIGAVWNGSAFGFHS
jgi:hypothetical protein